MNPVQLKAEITRRVRRMYPHRVRIDVGERAVGDDTTFNALLWPEDSDLYDVYPLGGIKLPEDRVYELDLYVYEAHKEEYENDLIENVSAFVRDGQVVEVTNKLSRIKELNEQLYRELEQT